LGKREAAAKAAAFFVIEACAILLYYEIFFPSNWLHFQGNKMVSNIQKVKLKAHRAIFSGSADITFEDIVTSIFRNVPDPTLRVSKSSKDGGPEVALAKFMTHPSNSGVAVVCSFYQPDAQRTTVSLSPGASEAKFGSQGAGDNNEFLDLNTVLFAVGDTVVSCALGGRTTSVCSAIHEIAVNAGLITPLTIFNLSDLPRPDVLDLINRVGVKKVEFNATVFLGALTQSRGDTIIEKIFSEIDTGEAIKRRRENAARISISSRLFHKNSELSIEEIKQDDWLSSVASTIFHDDDIEQYTFILGDNQRIRSGSLLRSKDVNLKRDGSSYDTQQAYTEMTNFYREIEQR
jgi:hypothetical protein